MDTFGQQDWGNPFAAAQQSPLASDWSNYFTEQMPSTGWWSQDTGQFGYANNASRGLDYDPGGSTSMYAPLSGLTNKIIDSDIEGWMRAEFPELYDFTGGGSLQGTVGVGKVGSGIGQFSRTPEVYQEMQAAANKYGVPVNFLQAIIAHESSGDWNANNRAPVIGTRGERILPFVGVFESAAKSWGFDFNSLIGNRAGQIEMLASGLRGMYDRLRSQNPSWGWEQVSNNHYSGDPTGGYTPGDAYQYGTTNEYTGRVMGWWKQLDAQAGNTWGNYTDTKQNTGVGSPQNAAWGQYAKWDKAIVGLSANTSAPANLLKSVLRFGQENGMNFAANFDAGLTPLATRLAQNYQATGDWGKSIASTLGLVPGSSQANKVQAYWDELNADMSGVFGGSYGGPAGPLSQIKAIWGGTDFPITQEHGPTEWSLGAGRWMYEYSVGVLGTYGHPGIDVGMPAGTKIYSPGGGTVIRTGSGSYNHYGAALGPKTGELRIRMDNGDELILGHMAGINVNIGDRVTAGSFVGLSGNMNGDHLHLEYRTPDPKMSSGWRAVDPRQVLSGQFTGYNQGAKTGLGYTTPLTFQNLMLAGAKGQPIPAGANFVQGGGNSSWTNWLANTMRGQQNQQTRAGGLDYGKIYSSNGTGMTR